MKSIKFLALFVILSFVFGCQQEAEENVVKPIPVKIYKVKTESISKFIRVTGTVTADEDVMVVSKTAERILKINVKPGQKVTEGQVIAVQKNDMLKQGVEMASSAYQTAEAQAKLSQQDYERMKMLFTQKAISRQQFDQAETAKETTEHALNQTKAALDQAEEQYENSFIKAPFSGIVAAVYVELNQMINMGQPVAQVISPSKMKAKVYLTGDDIQKIELGQTAEINFPNLPEKKYTGIVKKINSAIDQISKTLEVEIEFTGTTEGIKSGMFGEFLIASEKKENSIVIPETAMLSQTEIKIDRETGLQKSVKKYFVFTIQSQKANLVEVKTGIAFNGLTEITSGLHIGDSIVIVGQNIVKENQTVNVIE